MTPTSAKDSPAAPVPRIRVTIVVDGAPSDVPAGCTVAAALMSAGITAFRRSVSGTARAAVCGMGVCFECRVTIDGAAQQRSCLVTVRDGMLITTATPTEAP
jgi:sarcosine oxidase subunit alpha